MPQFMKALDVGLMSYERGTWAEGGSPVKLYEYSAADIPIVASRIDSLVEHEEARGVLSFADTPEEAVRAVLACIARDDADVRVRRREFARRHTWQTRAAQVHEALTRALSHVGV